MNTKNFGLSMFVMVTLVTNMLGTGFAEAPTFEEFANLMQIRQEIVVEQGKLSFVETKVYFETEDAFEKFLSQISNMAVPQSDPRSYILKQLDTASSMGKREFFSFGTYYYKGEKAHLTQKLDPERMEYMWFRRRRNEKMQLVLRKSLEDPSRGKIDSILSECFFDSETIRHYDLSKMKGRIVSTSPRRRADYFRISDIDIVSIGGWKDGPKILKERGGSVEVLPTENPNMYNLKMTEKVKESDVVHNHFFDLSINNFTRVTVFRPPTRKSQLVLQSDFHALENGVYVPFVHLKVKYGYSGPSSNNLKGVMCEVYVVESWQDSAPDSQDLVEGENIDITKFSITDEILGINY